MKTCHFGIDVFHVPIPYKNWYEKLPVELTDHEYKKLCKSRKKWMATGEWYCFCPEVDDEYYLMKHCPDILTKVRQALQEKAPDLWDERVIPHLDKVGIYVLEGIECE